MNNKTYDAGRLFRYLRGLATLIGEAESRDAFTPGQEIYADECFHVIYEEIKLLENERMKNEK